MKTVVHAYSPPAGDHPASVWSLTNFAVDEDTAEAVALLWMEFYPDDIIMLSEPDMYRGYEIHPSRRSVLILHQGEIVDRALTRAHAVDIIDEWQNAR